MIKIKKFPKIKVKQKEEESEIINPIRFNLNKDPIPFIQAAYAKVGEQYFNHSFTSVITITAINTHDHTNIYEWEVKYIGESLDGIMADFNGKIRGTTPLVPYNKNYTIGGVINMANKTKAVSAKKVAAGKALAKRAKEGLDPKIGAKPGTDAYEIGKIMLSFKEGAEHRKKSMENIKTYLQKKGFDEKKSATLGASWYSTLVNKKPDIYGKFKTSGKSAPVKKAVAEKETTSVEKKKVIVKKK